MSVVIRVPAEIYSRLKQHAKGFDTPANVIETLLNHYEGIDKRVDRKSQIEIATNSKDTTKYMFNNQQLGKGRLVLAVVKEYVTNNPGTSFDELVEIFPKHLQGSIGVFNEHDFVENKYEDKSQKRHYLKPEEIITLSDCNIVVCTEWGAGNIDNFIKQTKSIGYTITSSNG